MAVARIVQLTKSEFLIEPVKLWYVEVIRLSERMESVNPVRMAQLFQLVEEIVSGLAAMAHETIMTSMEVVAKNVHPTPNQDEILVAKKISPLPATLIHAWQIRFKE